MKRIWSMLFAVILLFNLSSSVYASGDTDKSMENRGALTHDELVEIALEVFPEHRYASEHKARSLSGQQCTELGTPISSETRNITDTEQITYTEYSSGYSLYTYQVDLPINSASSGTGYSTVNTDIYVYSYLLTGILYIRELSFTHVQYGYDIISSVGSVANNTIQAYVGKYKLEENADGPAYVYYTGVFENSILSANVVATLAVYVGNDNMTYEVY